MRQYSRVRGQRGATFKYSDMKPVYTIVIYEQSTAAFHDFPGTYIHHGMTTFDTGLKVELLQEYWLIALDVFRKIPYPNVIDEQTAWLSLLATEDVDDAERLAGECPWLAEIYREMEGYLHKPEEVLNMFSEALKIMDRNTVQYMIDLQKEQIVQLQDEIRKQKAQMQDEIKKQKAEMQEQKAQMQDEKAEMQDEIMRLRKLLSEKEHNNY